MKKTLMLGALALRCAACESKPSDNKPHTSSDTSASTAKESTAAQGKDPAQAKDAEGASSKGSFLVWSQDKDKGIETRWFEVAGTDDASAKEVARREGIVVAQGERLWWVSPKMKAKLTQGDEPRLMLRWSVQELGKDQAPRQLETSYGLPKDPHGDGGLRTLMRLGQMSSGEDAVDAERAKLDGWIHDVRLRKGFGPYLVLTLAQFGEGKPIPASQAAAPLQQAKDCCGEPWTDYAVILDVERERFRFPFLEAEKLGDEARDLTGWRKKGCPGAQDDEAKVKTYPKHWSMGWVGLDEDFRTVTVAWRVFESHLGFCQTPPIGASGVEVIGYGAAFARVPGFLSPDYDETPKTVRAALGPDIKAHNAWGWSTLSSENITKDKFTKP